jgi:predicted membrane protein
MPIEWYCITIFFIYFFYQPLTSAENKPNKKKNQKKKDWKKTGFERLTLDPD